MIGEQKTKLMKCSSGLGYIVFVSISKTGSKEVGRMTEEQFQAEKLYYISLSIAKSMLEKGVIDKEVLGIIDRELLEKYHPILGTLLAGKPLT